MIPISHQQEIDEMRVAIVVLQNMVAELLVMMQSTNQGFEYRIHEMLSYLDSNAIKEKS